MNTFSATHRGLAVGGVDQLGADNVDRQIDPFALAGLVVIADQLFGDDVIVGVIAGLERAAAFALAARRVGLGMLTEEKVCQRPRRRRLAHAHRPGKHQSVRQPIRCQRRANRIERRVLAEDVAEGDHAYQCRSIHAISTTGKSNAITSDTTTITKPDRGEHLRAGADGRDFFQFELHVLRHVCRTVIELREVLRQIQHRIADGNGAGRRRRRQRRRFGRRGWFGCVVAHRLIVSSSRA
jgi:hypothetical protein